MFGRGADVRIRWLLDVQDKGAGKKLLAQDREIRKSLMANDRQQRRTAEVATASGTKQVSSSKRVVGARQNETRSTRGLTGAVERLNTVQAQSLRTDAKVAQSNTRAASSYERRAAAAKRAAAAERAASRRAASAATRVGAGAAVGGAGGAAVAGGAARGGALAVGLGVGVALQQTVQFDKAMRNVNSIAQVGEKRFAALSAKVRDLGGATAQAPKTLAEGLYTLVSSGFNARQSMHILAKSARAATAGLTTTEVSTAAVSAVLNAYHLPASQAGKVSDQLFRTVDRGVISFESLAETVGDVLPFASSLGVGLEQVGASIATMTKAGIPAPETMTRIKNVMVTMLKPGEGLKAAFKDLGVESGEALIKQKGFQGALEALIGTTDGTKASVAKLFPNIRAMGGALALTGKNAKGAGQDLAGMQKSSGATARALAEQSKSVSYQWNKMKATAAGVAITVGSALIPAAKGAVSALGQFASQAQHGTGVGGQFRTIVENIGTAVGGVAQTIGPTIGALGKMALTVADLTSKFLASRAGIVVLTAAAGGLAARLGALAVAGVAAQFARMAAAVRLAGGAVGFLTAAVARNPIGVLAVAAGTVAGALLGFNRSAKESAKSVDDLAESNDALISSLRQLEDFDLEKQGRKLAARRAVMTRDDVKGQLADARAEGASTKRIKELKLQLAEANVEVKRSQRDLDRTTEDGRRLRAGASRDASQQIKDTREVIGGIKDERKEIRAEIKGGKERLSELKKGSEDWKHVNMGVQGSQDRLRANTKKLHGAQSELNDVLRQFAGPRTATVKVEGGGPALATLRSLVNVASQIDNAFDMTITAVRGRRGGRRGGRFQGGGMVPAAVSSGEALRFPDGSWAGVPGARTARDNVQLMLPSGTEVYTDHGQALMASGASRATALASQLPHFRGGGIAGHHPGDFDRKTKNYARIILSHGIGRSYRKAVTGVTAAMTETGGPGRKHGIIRNPHGGDGGKSAGLFQMTSDKGSVAQRSDPDFASRWFWKTVGGVSDKLPIGQMAQAVENSAYPGRYAQYADDARALISFLGFRNRDGRLRTGSEGSWETETYKGKWRPTQRGISAKHMDRFRRRAYLEGLSGDAFSTGYSAGQAGYRHLLRAPGVTDLIGGARVEGSRPDLKRRVFKGSRGPTEGKKSDRFLRARDAASKINAQHYHYSSPGNRNISSVPGGPMDCSGAVSKVLGPKGLGVLDSTQVSGYFKGWGQGGRGKYISTFAHGAYSGSSGHVFMKVGDRYFGTSRSNPGGGAGWMGTSYSTSGYIARHPRGWRRGGRVGGALARLPRRWQTPQMAERIERAHGIMPGLRRGGVVRFASGGTAHGIFNPRGPVHRSTPVQQRSAYFGDSGVGRLDEQLARLRQLGSRANFAATHLLSVIADGLDNAGKVTFRQLAQTRANLRREIARLFKHGTTRREEAQIQRLRAALDTVEAEMGRRTGMLVRHQQGLAALMEQRNTRLDQRLRMKGIAEDSEEGIKAQQKLQKTTARNLKKQRADLRKALKQAQKAGDKDAITEIKSGLRDVSTAIRETVVRKIELARQQAQRAAQERVSGAEFFLAFRQGQMSSLEATQRRNAAWPAMYGGGPQFAVDAPAQLRARSQALLGTIPQINAARDAAYGQYIERTGAGDTEGARAAYLQAQQYATDAVNAFAEALELNREAIMKEAQLRVEAAQFVLDLAQVGSTTLENAQRGTIVGGVARLNAADYAESPAAMRERAAYITNSLVPALAGTRNELYAAADVAKGQYGEESPEYRQALLAAENAGNELSSAMLDAAQLLRDAGLKAADLVVQSAAHGSTMADLQEQRLELQQRLAGTFETGGGARADFIRNTIIPALQAEVTALRAQEQAAKDAGDTALANQIAEALYGKENDVMQAQLDALEQTADNTDKMAERMGSLGFEFGGQQFTDYVESGTGV